MRSLSDLKSLFRKKIKVVAGGPPVGTPGSNRSEGVLESLDVLAEEVKTIQPGFSLTLLPNGDYQPSPELLAYLDAGGQLYWMSLNAAGQRTTILAKAFGVAPGNSAAANAAGVNAMRTNLLGQ